MHVFDHQHDGVIQASHVSVQCFQTGSVDHGAVCQLPLVPLGPDRHMNGNLSTQAKNSIPHRTAREAFRVSHARLEAANAADVKVIKAKRMQPNEPLYNGAALCGGARGSVTRDIPSLGAGHPADGCGHTRQAGDHHQTPPPPSPPSCTHSASAWSHAR